MTSQFDHASHPYRDSDHHVLIIMIATIVSSMWVTFWSVITVLGSGLASTPDSRVPRASNVLWWISGYAFFACIALFLATLITRKRPFAIALGLVVLAAGLALTGGTIVSWIENQTGWPQFRRIEIMNLVIPIIASIVILWESRGLLPWDSHPYIK